MQYNEKYPVRSVSTEKSPVRSISTEKFPTQCSSWNPSSQYSKRNSSSQRSPAETQIRRRQLVEEIKDSTGSSSDESFSDEELSDKSSLESDDEDSKSSSEESGSSMVNEVDNTRDLKKTKPWLSVKPL